MSYLEKLAWQWWKRLAALLDKSALMLIIPAFAGLWYIDPASAKTLVQWSLFALVIAGVAVMISRIIFPQIDLNKLLDSVEQKCNTGAGVVIGAIILFVGLLILALVFWAKP